MKINDQTLHERQVFARFDETDLHVLLTKKVADEAGFVIDPRKTRIKVIFSTKDRIGTAGFEPYAEVTLINVLPSGDGQ